jgi:tRNA nucleotidyltransferase (CCA-adding enzyme)
VTIIPDSLREKLVDISNNHGVGFYIVGGSVRDHVMGGASKDIDIEVFKAPEDFGYLLSDIGNVKMYDQKFQVYQLFYEDRKYEFTRARAESKAGSKHNEFIPDFGVYDLVTAAKRRDFRMNALYWSIRRDELVEPIWGSLLDIFNKKLSPILLNKFSEDPLRFIRGMQFTARFNMKASQTMREIGKMETHLFQYISREALWSEWAKWSESRFPAAGIAYLEDIGWLHHFPEIFHLIGVKQQPFYHKEGDAYRHTLMALEQYTRNADQKFALLCHDFGKAVTTDGDGHAYGHEGETQLTESFMNSIGAPKALTQRVNNLVRYHMAEPITTKGVRRLVQKLAPATLADWHSVVLADKLGRIPKQGFPFHTMTAINQAIEDEKNNTDLWHNVPAPWINGLIIMEEFDVEGPIVGVIKKLLYEEQLDEKFYSLESGLYYIQHHHEAILMQADMEISKSRKEE